MGGTRTIYRNFQEGVLFSHHIITLPSINIKKYNIDPTLTLNRYYALCAGLCWKQSPFCTNRTHVDVQFVLCHLCRLMSIWVVNQSLD